MSERTQNFGFALAWVLGVLLLAWAIPHAFIGTKLSTLFLGSEKTWSRWAVYLISHTIFLSLLWYAARSYHVYVRDFSDSFLKNNVEGLLERFSLGLVWSIVTVVTTSLLLGIGSTGPTGSLRAYMFDLLRGKFDSKALIGFFLLIGLLIAILMASRNIWTLYRKEFRIYFSTPIVYVMMLLFTFLIGYFFFGWFSTFDSEVLYQMKHRRSAGLNLNDFVLFRTFKVFSFILLFMTPILGMRLLAEEKHNKTFELLMTSPLTTFEIVASKYLSVISVLAVMLGLTFVYPLMLGIVSDGAFEWAPVFTSYLGLFLLASSFAAIALFCSSLTENQIIAAALSFGILLLLWVIGWAASQMSSDAIKLFGYTIIESPRETIAYLSILTHLESFLKGVIEIKDVIYYLSVMFFASFMAHRMIESQRWR